MTSDTALESLLAPLGEASPCGDNLEYDAAFLALDEAARGKAEQQFGDTVIAAQESDWRAMHEQALALAERTRDLRVAMHLLRAATRLHGLDGLATGLRLVHGLLQRHWAHVHPQLDAQDNNDATMRLNALAPLAAAATLAEVRNAGIGAPQLGLTLRTVELGFGKKDAPRDAAAQSESQLVQALTAADAAAPGVLDALLAVHAATSGIRTELDAHVGAANGPDLRPLLALTATLDRAARAVRGEPASAMLIIDSDTGPRTAATGIASREAAIASLEQVCQWLERSEPSNPAPLLIRRAQRLMSKSFIDIVRDLAPDGLKEVQRIAGIEAG